MTTNGMVFDAGNGLRCSSADSALLNVDIA